MKKVLKIIGRIILALVIVIALALGVLTIAEYRPAARETIIADHPAEAVLKTEEPMTMVIWNIGYGALGDNADFFMDGGTGVYTADRERVQQNLAGIRETLAGLDAASLTVPPSTWRAETCVPESGAPTSVPSPVFTIRRVHSSTTAPLESMIWMWAPSSSAPSAMSTLLTLMLVFASSTRSTVLPFSSVVFVPLDVTLPVSSIVKVVSDVMV